jgi:ATP-binding cassette subfamily F protein uup
LEKRELAGMEAAIEAAEAQVSRLEAEISAPDFYAQPHDRTRGVLAALDTAKSNASSLYIRWEELEARAGES